MCCWTIICDCPQCPGSKNRCTQIFVGVGRKIKEVHIGTYLRPIWEEFEAALTPTAQFAKALDRFQPPMLNLASGGGSWTDYGVSEETIAARVGTKIERGAPGLWAYASKRISAFFASVS